MPSNCHPQGYCLGMMGDVQEYNCSSLSLNHYVPPHPSGHDSRDTACLLDYPATSRSGKNEEFHSTLRSQLVVGRRLDEGRLWPQPQMRV